MHLDLGRSSPFSVAASQHLGVREDRARSEARGANVNAIARASKPCN